jgi:hypothetical protein
MNAKEFFAKVPYLCEAHEPERWARMIELVYDDEMANPNGPFARNALDEADPENRFEMMFSFKGNPGKMEHCKKLVWIIFLSHYMKKHGEEEHEAKIKDLVSYLAVVENDNPEIADTLTSEQAMSVMGWSS